MRWSLSCDNEDTGSISSGSLPFTTAVKLIGTLIPDLIVDDLVIADPKAVTAFNDAHQAQMIGDLAITDLRLAILLNFKSAKLEWKRIVR